MSLSKENATGSGGAAIRKLGGGGSEDTKILSCDQQHIRKLSEELAQVGLTLKGTSGDTQGNALLRTLQYLGPRGLNTIEGTALGYLRIATRIQELEETYEIASLREPCICSDNQVHIGIARYVLMGKRADMICPQLDLGLEVVP